MKNKILIIEDNYDVRENLGEILHLAGYEILLAENGKKGAASAIANLPDLILCDIMMPELDGYAVLRILSKNELTENIPFIFLTAKTEWSDLRKGMTLGADDYITKPFDDIELLDTIEMRLKKRAASEGIETGNSKIKTIGSWEQIASSLPEQLLREEPRLIRKKDMVFTEGQNIRNVFLIRSGKAIATKVDHYGKEVVTRLYHSPMIIGIDSAFSGQRYHETVKAFEDLEIIPIHSEEIIPHILHHPMLAHFFLKEMASNQAHADEKLLLQAFGSVRMKLAATLVDLYSFYQDGRQAIIPVSREDLASMAGTAKETIIRCLSEFKEEGLITIQGSDIRIESIQKLSDLRY
jgi:DNA-binding response OmpR family regulator